MDFSKIKYFLTLAEELNFTKAADILFISQSMLSRHIKSIEDEFGVPLFSRSTREVSLSPAGKVLYKSLKNLLFDYDVAVQQIKATQQGYSGEIKIGILNSWALGHFGILLAQYESVHPDLKIILSSIETPRLLFHKLMNLQLDFGIAMHMDLSYYQKISSLSLHKNDIYIVMSKLHRFAAAENNSLSINDFREETFITAVEEVSIGYRQLIERCSKAGFTPKVVTLDDYATVILWVELNRGVTFLHETSLFKGNANLVFSRLHDIEQNGSLTLFWNDDYHEPRVSEFLDYIRQAAPY